MSFWFVYIGSVMVRWRFTKDFINGSHIQIQMSQLYQQPLPTYEQNPFIQNEGISMVDYMANYYLSRVDYLDVSEYYGGSIEFYSSKKIDEEMKEYVEKVQNDSTLDKSMNLEKDREQGPSQDTPKSEMNSFKSPKRDYAKNITKNVVQSCCREFRKDKRSQKIIKRMCKIQKIAYQDFVDLMKEILKEYHISNYILLTKFLAPQANDHQFIIKKMFAKYFRYFLRHSLLRVLLTSPKIKDVEAYINYSNRYLLNLDTNSVIQDISQNNRI